jgi:hypothetical protein
MKQAEKTPESMLAWFSYQCINYNLSYGSTKTYFNKPITRKDLIDMITKDVNVTCSTFIDCHNHIKKDEKLFLLNIILTDKDSVETILRRMGNRLISYEYPIIVSYVIKNYPDLMDQVLEIYKMNDMKFIKSMKLDKDIQEKLESYLIMNKLTQ